MMSPHVLKFMSFWPPFWGAGIRVERISKDYREIDVSMKLRFWNKNYVGTHFGGSMYSMTDPFYMLMLLQNLGRGHIVWDKAATIRFKKPGKGKIRCEFRLTQEAIDQILKVLETQDKYEPTFKLQILDETNEVVAEVDKLLYIKKKNRDSQ